MPDGCEATAGHGLEDLQIDQVPVAGVLFAWSQRWLGDRVQLLRDLPGQGEDGDDVWTVKTNRGEVVSGQRFGLLAGLDGRDLNDDRHEWLRSEHGLHSDALYVGAQFERLGFAAFEGELLVVLGEGRVEVREE